MEKGNRIMHRMQCLYLGSRSGMARKDGLQMYQNNGYVF